MMIPFGLSVMTLSCLHGLRTAWVYLLRWSKSATVMRVVIVPAVSMSLSQYARTAVSGFYVFALGQERPQLSQAKEVRRRIIFASQSHRGNFNGLSFTGDIALGLNNLPETRSSCQCALVSDRSCDSFATQHIDTAIPRTGHHTTFQSEQTFQA